VNGATLGALAGFFGALVPIGIGVVAFGLRLDRRTRKAVRLLTGHEEVEDDGVLPRLREVEGEVENIEATLDAADGIDYKQSAGGSTA
jgi:hypothetical protein